MIVFKFALLRSLRSPVPILVGMVVPVAIILLLRESWTYAPAVGVGMWAMLMMYSSYYLAAAILEDRVDGSVIRVLISPVSTFSYILQNLLSAILPLVIQIVLLGIVGYTRYNWTMEFTMALTLTMLLFSFANTAFVFCWNMFFKSKEGSKYAYWFAAALIALFGGLIIPNFMLPGVMQNVGGATHPYWLMKSVNLLVDVGMNMEFWLFQGILILLAVAFLLLGSTRRKIA